MMILKGSLGSQVLIRKRVGARGFHVENAYGCSRTEFRELLTKVGMFTRARIHLNLLRGHQLWQVKSRAV
jgi:hypothetical protein